MLRLWRLVRWRPDNRGWTGSTERTCSLRAGDLQSLDAIGVIDERTWSLASPSDRGHVGDQSLNFVRGRQLARQYEGAHLRLDHGAALGGIFASDVRVGLDADPTVAPG